METLYNLHKARDWNGFNMFGVRYLNKIVVGHQSQVEPLRRHQQPFQSHPELGQNMTELCVFGVNFWRTFRDMPHMDGLLR